MAKHLSCVSRKCFIRAKFIEETILSVIGQDYPNLEYIVIDGGSKDNTVDILKKYEKHFTYWVSEKDSGQSEAINKGFKKASGEIVCWLNSDDIFIKDALHKVVKFFNENQELNLVNGQLILIDEHSRIISSNFNIQQKKWYAKHGIYYISQPSLFWKREIFDKVGFLREDFHASMDLDFLIKIFKNNYKVGHLERILSGFRMHTSSKSSAGWDNVSFLRDLKELKKIHGKDYGGRPHLVFKMLYGFEKLFEGIYFKNWLFTRKWKDKPVKDLITAKSKYL